MKIKRYRGPRLRSKGCKRPRAFPLMRAVCSAAFRDPNGDIQDVIDLTSEVNEVFSELPFP